MEMDNSLRDAMAQMVNLQAQSLAVLRELNNNNGVNAANAAVAYAMPNANAFTNYTNYAPSYQPSNPSPFTPSSNYLNEAKSYLSGGNSYTLSDALNGVNLSGQNLPTDGMKSMILAGSKRYNTVQRETAVANTAGRLTNATVAGAGSILGFGAELLGYGAMGRAGVGLIGSSVLGLGIGTGVSAVTEAILDGAKQSQAYNKYMIQNSYRFINPLESGRAGGGFTREDRWKAANTLRWADANLNISDDEVSSLLEKYTETGLLKSTSDVESFGKKFEELTKYVKSAAYTLGTAYDDTAELMGELEKNGILSKDFTSIASLSKIAGSYAGISSTEAISTLSSIASGLASDTAADTSNLYKNSAYAMTLMGQIDEESKRDNNEKLINIIANVGGVEGATGSVTNTLYNSMLNNSKYKYAAYLGFDTETGEYSSEAFKKNYAAWQAEGGTTGDLSDIVGNIITKMQESHPLAMEAFIDGGGISEISQLSFGDMASVMKGYADSIRLSNPEYANADTADILQLAGGFSETEAELISAAIDQMKDFTEEDLEKQENTAKAQADFMSEYLSFTDKIVKAVDTVANSIGDIGADLSGGIDSLAWDISTWLDPSKSYAETERTDTVFGDDFIGDSYKENTIDDETAEIIDKGFGSLSYASDVGELSEQLDAIVAGGRADEETKTQAKNLSERIKKRTNDLEAYEKAAVDLAWYLTGDANTFYDEFGDLDFIDMDAKEQDYTASQMLTQESKWLDEARKTGGVDTFISNLTAHGIDISEDNAKAIKSLFGNKNISNEQLASVLLSGINTGEWDDVLTNWEDYFSGIKTAEISADDLKKTMESFVDKITETYGEITSRLVQGMIDMDVSNTQNGFSQPGYSLGPRSF